MTKLEEEIRKAIPDYDTAEFTYADEYWDMVAKSAAEVAKKYIEKALHDAYYAWANEIDEESDFNLPVETVQRQWLKENGIV